MSNNEEIIKNLKAFLLVKKFKKDESIHYNGLSNKKDLPKVNELLNISINEFISKIKIGATETDLQLIIETGLNRFNDLNLDTEDRERLCMYFEEIMDIINLESSNGIINNWMYGFDV
jgi:hypothetical protein